MRKTHHLLQFAAAVLLLFLLPLPCSAAAPDIPFAKSVILYDLTDNAVLYENNADAVLSPSSIAKFVTGALSYRLLLQRLDESVTITEQLLKDAPKTKLKAGSQYTFRDLIRLAVCQRNNDAAYVLANACSGSAGNFVTEMNRFAIENYCVVTEFTNPAGLEYGTYFGQSSALDLVSLFKNVIANDGFLSLFDENVYTNSGVKMTLLNKGMTDTVGYCRVTLCTVCNHRLLSIVLGAESEEDARECTDTLSGWVNTSFDTVTVVSKGQTLGKIPVKNGAKTAELELSSEREITVFSDNAADVQSTVRYEIHLFSEHAEAPVAKGDCLGTVIVFVGDKVVGTENVVAAKDVEANSFSLAIYRFGEIMHERKMIATVSMMAVLFTLYFVVIHQKNKQRQILLTRFRNEHKDIYKR